MTEQTWAFSPLAPPPPWRDAPTLWRLFARLSPPQLWALERVIAQQGKGCGVPLGSLYALVDRGLMVSVCLKANGGWRCCYGCYRPRYYLPPEVVEAFAGWCAQWEPSLATSGHHAKHSRGEPTG